MNTADQFAELLSEHVTPEDAARLGCKADPGGDVVEVSAKLGIRSQYGHTILYNIRKRYGWQAQ